MHPVTGLSLGRVAAGVVALSDPERAARLLGLDASANPQLPFMTRLFGAREVAIGLATLVSRDAARRNLTLAGVLVDGSDAAIAWLAVREGLVSRRNGWALIAPAAGGVASGLVGLLRRR